MNNKYIENICLFLINNQYDTFEIIELINLFKP